MSFASISIGDADIARRKRAVWRALVASAQPAQPRARRQVREVADAPLRPGEIERSAMRPIVFGALAVALLHAALVAAWLHARPARQEPPIAPPIALQMTAPPRPLPQAPAPAPNTPTQPTQRKTLPQARHAMKPQQLPAPTQQPKPAPTSQTPLPEAAPSLSPADSAARAAASPTAPAPPAPPAQKTTLPDANADYLHNPAPEYPPAAQDHDWQGTVLLRVHVRADGSSDTVEVRTSSGHRVLDDAAVAAVRHWRFVPAKRGDTPVDGWVDVPLNFQLN